MSDNLRRYADLLRLHERGRGLDNIHPPMFSSEAKPWATVVRDVGFIDIDARADFEKAAHTFDESSPRAGDVRAALAAIAREARSRIERMSDEEKRAAMLHWMYLSQIKAATKRIAATIAELSRELGQDEVTVNRWIDRARADGLVTFYREPKPGKPPDYYCLSEDGLVRAGDPITLAGQLAGLAGMESSPAGHARPVARYPAMLPPEDCHLIADCLRGEVSSLQALGGWLADHSVGLPNDGEVAHRIEAMEALAMKLMGTTDPLNPPSLSEDQRALAVLALDAAIAHGRDRLATLRAVARHPDVTRPAAEPLRKLETIRGWPIFASTLAAPRIGLRDLLTDDGIAQLRAERKEFLRSIRRAGIDVGGLSVEDEDGETLASDDDVASTERDAGASIDPSSVSPSHKRPSGGVKAMTPDRRTVFVVHGRNKAAKVAVFDFLRALDLKPLEWSQAAKLTGEASPYILDVVEAGLAAAQAVVVILTGEDVAKLHPGLRNTHEPDRASHLQPRPNVLLETGMAVARGRDRTVVVEFGDLRGPSDLEGINTIRIFRGDPATFRNDLASRLQTAGCEVNRDGSDWLTRGNFDAAFLDLPIAAAMLHGSRPADSNSSKLQGLRTVVGRQLVNKKNRYFDPARVLDLFTRYEPIRDHLRALPVFDDLPVRALPRPSETTDNDGRGYIERRHLEDLAHDIEYCLTILEPT